MASKQDTKTAVAVKEDILNTVASKVKELESKGEIRFPKNYAPENALKSAWLMLQDIVNRDKKPVLSGVCTKASIYNALLRMVIQGLNPDKMQCYFIAYGNKLLLQPSYFGKMHVSKSVNETIDDIYGKTVYEDDEFEYEIKHGKEVVTLHKQKLSNIHKDKIVGAYATVLYKDGRELSTVMTLDQIKQAWKQSPMNPVDEKGKIKAGSTHDKFTADMCEKTAINKLCKFIINSSDDSNLVAKIAKENDAETHEAEVEAEIAENANQEIIDIDSDEIIDVESEPVQEQEDAEPEQVTIEEGPGY